MRVRLLGFQLWQCLQSLSPLLSPGVMSELKYSSLRYRGRSEALCCLPPSKRTGPPPWASHHLPEFRLSKAKFHLPSTSRNFLSIDLCYGRGLGQGQARGSSSRSSRVHPWDTKSDDCGLFQSSEPSALFWLFPQRPFYKPCLDSSIIQAGQGWGNAGWL